VAQSGADVAAIADHLGLRESLKLIRFSDAS